MKKHLPFFLRCAGSLLLLAVVAWRVNWGAVGGMLREIRWPPAAAAFALFPVLIALLAARWRLFLQQASLPATFGQVWRVTWAAQFLNSVLPGSTGGDLLKIVEATRSAPERRSEAIATVVSDRLSALLALLALGAVSLLLLGPELLFGLWQRAEVARWVWLALGLAAAGATALLLYLRRSSQWRERVWQLGRALRQMLRPSPRLLFALSLAFLAHLAVVLIFWLTAVALNLGVGFVVALSVVPVVLIAALLPVTVNGHGLREALLVGLLGLLAAPGRPGTQMVDAVFALSTCLVTADLLWSLPGGLWYLRGRSAERAVPDRSAP